MTNSEFMNILNDDSLELTVEELENIIEEELQKDESEMDPDLIEYCLYYISKAETEGGKEKKADSAGNDKITEPPAADKLKKSRFNGKLKNLLIIAATIALLLVTTGIATVATNKKVKNSAITFYENHIQVLFDKQKEESGIPGTEIAAELKKHDISDLKLPAMFFSSDCIYSNILEDIPRILNPYPCHTEQKNCPDKCLSVGSIQKKSFLRLISIILHITAKPRKLR